MEIWTGSVLVIAAVWFNVTFARLASTFDYPDVLREPAAVVLGRFRAGGTPLLWRWWTFAMSGLWLIPTVVLVGQLADPGSPLVTIATIVGVLAALVQLLGLIRWVFLVPWLARTHEVAEDEDERRSIEIAFEGFHRFLGVAVGEHLGYLLTGLWTTLIGVALALTDPATVPSWLAWVAVPIGVGLVLGSGEFLGPNEERGSALAGRAIPVLYVVWSAWLIALAVGVAL